MQFKTGVLLVLKYLAASLPELKVLIREKEF